MKNNNKGNILLITILLTTVIISVTTLSVSLFYREYNKILREKNELIDKIELKVQAQDIHVKINNNKESQTVDSTTVTYENNKYTYSLTDNKYTIDVELNDDLKIIKFDLYKGEKK